MFSTFSHDHIEIICVNSELLFFKQRDSPYYPTLRLLHQCELFNLFVAKMLHVHIRYPTVYSLLIIILLFIIYFIYYFI
jgi:hypothetical protein